jgi:hypothetical protein
VSVDRDKLARAARERLERGRTDSKLRAGAADAARYARAVEGKRGPGTECGHAAAALFAVRCVEKDFGTDTHARRDRAWRCPC